MADRSASFGIRLSKESFTFSAAHFITYAGDVCEPLHGHNYRVTVEIEGPLDENEYVLDFIATRDAVAAIAGRLDHRVLLPTEHRDIEVRTVGGPLGGQEVVATFRDRRWVFPADECVLLPMANTTAERLAEWIGRELLAAAPLASKPSPGGVTITVDECDGQVGLCRLDG